MTGFRDDKYRDDRYLHTKEPNRFLPESVVRALARNELQKQDL